MVDLIPAITSLAVLVPFALAKIAKNALRLYCVLTETSCILPLTLPRTIHSSGVSSFAVLSFPTEAVLKSVLYPMPKREAIVFLL